MAANTLLLYFQQYIPLYLVYLVSGLVFLALFYRAWSWLTPYQDGKLLLEGNMACALSLGGALLGMTLVLASSALHANQFFVWLFWGLLGSLFQLLLYRLLTLFVPQVPVQIAQGNTAIGLVTGTLSFCLGLLNAAALT